MQARDRVAPLRIDYFEIKHQVQKWWNQIEKNGALAICCHLFPTFDSNSDKMPVFLSDKLFDKQQYDNIISDTLFEGLATKYIYDTNVNTLQIIFSFSLPSKWFSSEGSASNI